MPSKRRVLSDKELLDRLISMGLLSDRRTVNEEVMAAFAGIFSGLFFWDIRQSEAQNKTSAQSVYGVFRELNQSGDYQNMYLMLSVQYDQMGKSLPDSVWWLMCSDIAVKGFTRHFMERFDAYMVESGAHRFRRDTMEESQ